MIHTRITHMEKEVLQKSIQIGAPAEKIWEVLINPSYNRIWYGQFNEGSFAETDWQAGSRIRMDDGTGNGLIGRIVANDIYQHLKIEYLGFLENGQEDLMSPDAINVKGFTESYFLLPEGSKTILIIEQETSAEHLALFKKMWDRALKKIKQLSENKAMGEF